MKTWHSLKRRLAALVLLAAFAVAMLAPTGSAEASGSRVKLPSTASQTAEQVLQRVSWNSGPQ